MSRALVSSKPKERETSRNTRVLLDALGYIEEVSPGAARFLQRSRDSLLRTPFAALVCDEDRRSWLKHFVSYRQPGRKGRARLMLHIGRSPRAVEISTDTSSFGALRFNVTLQKSPRKTERSRSHRRPADLIDHIDDLVMAVDRRGIVRFANRPILQDAPEQLIGTSFYNYVRPYELKLFTQAIENAFASVRSAEFIDNGLLCFPPEKHFRVRIKPLPRGSAARKAKAAEPELAMIVFSDITHQQSAEAELDRIHHVRQRVAQRANLIREEERRRLAVELHDQVGQSLTVLKIDLALARRKVEPGKRSRALKSAESTVDHLISLVRELSAELRPPLLDDLGLAAALQFQMENFQKRTGIRGVFRARTEDIVTSAETALGIFRVFQEIMTNVIRHSRASEVEVSLDVHGRWLALTVSDNGCGITEEELYSPRSLGLIGMRERAQELGGTIQIQSGLMDRTTVVMQVPVSPKGRRRLWKGTATISDIHNFRQP